MFRITIVFISIYFSTSICYAAVAAPSYRSSVVEDGKPILRMRDDETPSEYGSKKDYGYDDPVKLNSDDLDEPETWMENAQDAINIMQRDLGYERAQPYIEKLIDDAKNHYRIRINVKVVDGQTKLTSEKITDESSQPVARSKHVKLKQQVKDENAEPVVVRTNGPDWLVDLKSYVRYLVDKYNTKDGLKAHIKPIVRAVQKSNGVRIEDIDIDQFGNVLIQFVNKEKTA